MQFPAPEHGRVEVIWLSRHPLKVEIAGSNPVATAQERQTDKA
jgi:hypothetical protein